MTMLFVFFFVFGGVGFFIFLFVMIKKIVSPKKLVEIERLIENGNTKVAIRKVKNILARNERNPDAHWFLGECYRVEKRPDLAIVEYKYITGTGKFTNIATAKKVRERLAHEYLKLGQIDESQKEFILLSKLDPNNYETYFNIGKLFEERDYTDSALTNYKKVIAIKPDHPLALMRIGILLFKKKALNEANKVLMESLKYSPQNFACYFTLGRISRATGDTETALIQFEKAMKDPEYRQRSLFERANIFIVKRDINQAVNELERAINLGEEDVPVLLASRYLLAQCYEATKDLVRAIEQWENIYELNPKYRDVAEKLAIYSDLRTDDRLKDLLTASKTDFQTYCTRLIESMGLAIQDVFLRSPDIVEMYALETQSKWRNAKKAPSFVKVFRSVDPIGYDEIRVLYDQMRKINAMRSICISASKFTRRAIEFAQIRPIELVDKDELSKLLDRIEM
jgi:tetratricopeptide (TPR) repeat protein